MSRRDVVGLSVGAGERGVDFVGCQEQIECVWGERSG